MQNQPHPRPALKTLTVCVRRVFVWQARRGHTAGLGPALDIHSSLREMCTGSILSMQRYTYKINADTTTLTAAWSGSRNSRWPTFVHTYPIIPPALAGLGANKTLSRPTIHLSCRSHLYFCKCMVVDWLWLAASWNWAPAFKLIFVFFLHQRQCSLNTFPRVGWAQIPMDSKNFTPLCAFMDVRSCFEKVNGCFEHSTF